MPRHNVTFNRNLTANSHCQIEHLFVRESVCIHVYIGQLLFCLPSGDIRPDIKEVPSSKIMSSSSINFEIKLKRENKIFYENVSGGTKRNL